MAAAGPDGFELKATPEIVLREGVNRVRVVAASAAGEHAAEFIVSYTPPPVRVEIDRIDEVGPGGRNVPIGGPGSGSPQATGAFLEVRGRVVWTRDNDPIADDPALEVVLSANQVTHLPVPFARRVGSAKERAFVAPVFLNAPTTAVKVEVRTRSRPDALPQQGAVAVKFEVGCKNPLIRQRLHVLVIGVDTPDRDRPRMARDVVKAVRGTIPANRPGFDGGEFQHPAFSRAVLYPPLVYDVDRSDIVGLLRKVEREIRQTVARDGEAWVNDVVLVYYQGRDLRGKDNVRRLHTTRSLVYAAGAADRFAVRVDELPPTPGVRLVVLNVVNPDKEQTAQLDGVLIDPLLLRYPWKNPAGTTLFLTTLEGAVSQQSTVGGVLDRVRELVGQGDAATEPPTDQVPLVVRNRRFGAIAP
jgi:hypothetical protein